MNESRVSAYLEVLQKQEEGTWGFLFNPKPAYWKVEYRGFAPPCKFHIELASGMLLLHAKLGFEIWPRCHVALYRYALRLNEEISGAKLGLSNAGELSLMVDWPFVDAGQAEFTSAVQILLGNYQRYYQDLALVAQDRNLAQHIAAAEYEQLRLEDELGIEIFERETLVDHRPIEKGRE